MDNDHRHVVLYSSRYILYSLCGLLTILFGVPSASLFQVDGGGSSGGDDVPRTAPENVTDDGCLDFAPNKLCIGLSLLICLLAHSIRNAANNNNNNRGHR